MSELTPIPDDYAITTIPAGDTLALSSSYTVAANTALILEEGSKCTMSGNYLYVRGTLQANWESEAEALTGSGAGYSSYVRIENGGLLSLANASINISGSGQVYVYSGGRLEMEGGSLYAKGNGTYIASGGEAVLTGTEVRSYVNAVGNLTSEGSTYNSYIQVSDSSKLSGSGNTFTGSTVFVLSNFAGNTGDMWGFIGAATAEDAHVNISGTLNDCVFASLPESLTGGYRLTGHTTVAAGKSVTLEEGVSWDMEGNRLYVEGEFHASNSEKVNILANEGDGYVEIRRGGAMRLKNSSIRVADSNNRLRGDVTVGAGGALEMNGGDVMVNVFYVRGLANLTDAYVRCSGTYVYDGGVLEAEGTEFYYSVTGYNGSTLRLTDCTFDNYLAAYGESVLTGVTCATLYVSSASSIESSGVTVSGAEAFRLDGWSGDTEEFFNSFSWEATAENPYVGISGTIGGDSTFRALPESLTGGYRLTGHTTVAAGKSVTLEEGVSWDMNGQYLYINGALNIAEGGGGDAFFSGAGTGRIYVQNGGALRLKDANINLTRSSSWVAVDSGGVFEMEGGLLRTGGDRLHVRGGTATLTGVEITNYITNEASGALTLRDCDLESCVDNYGELEMTDCTTSSYVTIRSGSAATISNTSGITTLNLSLAAGELNITGNDFSQTRVALTDLSGGGVVDLSGNYWGTTNMDEIIAKIANYSEERVLISSILEAPQSQDFSFDAGMYSRQRITHTATKLVLAFNHAVDADTVNATTLKLLDDNGNQVAVKSYEVEGKTVTLEIDPLAVGQYTVEATEGIKDTDGRAFTPAAAQGDVVYHCLAISAPKVILFRTNSTVTDHFNYVDVFFDQMMDPSTISKDSFHIYNESGEELAVSRILQAGVKGNIFWRAYFETATHQGTYTVTVDRAVESVDGISMGGLYTHDVYVSSPDLQILAPAESSDNKLGRYTTISYTVTNTGDGAAAGTWTDTVYICRSPEWDESQAIVFGRVTRAQENMAAGGSYTASVKGLLDGLLPGTYYVFVKTDVSGTLSEVNESNNITATGGTLEIQTVAQPLGEHTERLSSANESLHYSFTATEDGTMMFAVDSVTAKVYAAVEGKQPNAANNLAAAYPINGQKIAYIPVKAGETYHVAVLPGKAGSYTTSLREGNFELLSSSNTAVASGKASTMTLYGAGFAEGIEVYLMDDSGNRYDAQSCRVINLATAIVTFELPEGLGGGSPLTLCAENASGDRVSLNTPIDVPVDMTDAIQISFLDRMVNERRLARAGWVWRTDIDISNRSNYDIDHALVLITDTEEEFALFYDYQDAQKRDRSALLLMGGEDELTPGTLVAGEQSRLGIYAKQYRSGTGEIQAYVLDPSDQREITASQWADFESALRPADTTDAEWNAWWDNMQPRIGNTVGDFVTFVNGMKELIYTKDQESYSSLADLTEAVMQNHPEFVPNYMVSGVLHNSVDGSVLAGEKIYVYEIRNGERIFMGSTTTNADGTYRYDGLREGGVYELSSSLNWDNDGDGLEDLENPLFTVDGTSDVVYNGSAFEYSLQENEIKSILSTYKDDNGNLYRLSRHNGGTIFSYKSNGSWIDVDVSIDNEAYVDMCWSDSMNCMLIVWTEQVGDGYRVAYQKARIDDEGLQCSQVFRLPDCKLDHGKFNLAQSSDGNVNCITYENNASDIIPLFIKIQDKGNTEWNIISPKYATVAETGAHFEYKFAPKNKLLNKFFGLGWGKFSGGITLDVSKPDDGGILSASFSGSASYGMKGLAGRDTAHTTLTLTVDGSATAECQQGTLDGTANYGASFTVDVLNKAGLISLIGAIPHPATSTIAAGLKTIDRFLRLVCNWRLLAGYELDTTISWSSEDKGVVPIGLNISVFIGAEAIKNSESRPQVKLTGTASWEFKIDFNSYDLSTTDFSLSGSLDVVTPSIGGNHFEYHGSFMDLIHGDTSFKWVHDSNGKKTAITIEGSDSKYGVSVLTHDGSSFSLYNNDGELLFKAEKEDISVQGKLYGNPNAIIEDSTAEMCYSGNVIAASIGFTAGNVLGDANWSMSTIEDYAGQKKQETVMESSMIDMNTGNYYYIDQSNFSSGNVIYNQITRPSHPAYRVSGLAANEITSDNYSYTSGSNEVDLSTGVTDVDLVTYQNDTCLTWITLATGHYQLYTSFLDGNVWCAPTLVYESSGILSGCLFQQDSDGIILTVSEAVENRDGSYTDRSLDFCIRNNRWVSANADLPSDLQTGSVTNDISSLSEWGMELKRILKDVLKCVATDKPADELPHDAVQSWDPNDIYGPTGYGEKNWVSGQEMQFQIECENIAEENIAHAAMVTITQQIDAAYDYSTFRLGDMMIAGQYIEVEGDVQSYKARLDWTKTLGVLVDVNAFFDADTGKVTWEFVAIDPETMMVVSDPFSGLLAPNYNSPEGEGYVYYYVTPQATATSGTTIKAQADIIFDYNDPILTPTLTYTIDNEAPDARVTTVEDGNTRYLRVSWVGEDAGAGIACYNVFVSVDGGDWELWQQNINATSALYAKAEGEHVYHFFAQGIDHAGNAESLGETAASEATKEAAYTAPTLAIAGVGAARTGDTLELEILFNEKAACADWAAALEVAAGETRLDLAQGSFSYDEAAHKLTWNGAAQGIADGQKLSFRLHPEQVQDAAGVAMPSVAPSFALIAQADVGAAAYAAPTFYDYNGDGLTDLLVGEVVGSQGKVRLYLNEGTAEAAAYSTFRYLTTGADTPLTVPAMGCQGAIVRFADLNGEGEAAMFVGLADGTVRVYTPTEGGHWVDAGLLNCTAGGKESTVSVGERAALEFVDFNGDGRTDLLVGAGDGRVVLYLNTAEKGMELDGGRYLHDSAGHIDVGSRASIAAGDMDNDGRMDLLVGTASGTVLFYRNEGSATEPLFAEAVSIRVGDADLNLSEATSRARIAAADLNGDGVLDLAVGQSDGKVLMFYGTDNTLLLGEAHAGAIPLPDAPRNLAWTRNGSTLTLRWDAAEGEQITYEVRYQLPDGTETTVQVGAETTLMLENLADGAYSVQVRALNQGHAGNWSEAVTAPVDTVAPEMPSTPQSVVGEQGVTLSWAQVSDASGVSYELRYKAGADGTWRTVTNADATLELTAMDAADYIWQVRAVDGAGNASAWTPEQSFTVGGTAPDAVKHWANGLTFTPSGDITGGWYDVNKTGDGDSQLCWAAAASNTLAWWQANSVSGNIGAGIPREAADIYATMTSSWQNSSGADVYGFIWWLAGESESTSFSSYYQEHYTGEPDGGAYYGQYYTGATVSDATAQVSLAGQDATTLAETWNDIYVAGGMLTLGLFRSVNSNGTLSGGHSLTLWGFAEDSATGQVTELYVTDSDDGTTQLTTLRVGYDETAGYYRVESGSERLSGYVLGSYTYLEAFTGKDIVAPTVTLETPLAEKLDGGRMKVTLRWHSSEAAIYTLTVDGVQYNVRGATSWTVEVGDGEHSYRVEAADGAGNVGQAEGAFSTDATAPDAVSNLATEVRNGSVRFSWTSAWDESAVTYELEYAFNADFKEAQSVSGLTETSCELPIDVTTGWIYWRVKAIDTAGNISSWSAVAEGALDVIAPDLPAAGLAVVAHGTAAQLTWDAAQDASGIASYLVEYATSEDFSGEVQRIRVSSPGAAFYMLAENTTYYWRVAAVDGAGNVGKWVEGDSFRTGVADVADDAPDAAQRIIMSDPAGGESHNITIVHDWVGFDDARDFYTFTARGTGSYAIGLTGDTPLGTPVYLSVGMLDESGAFRSEYRMAVAPESATAALAGIRLKEGQDYYIRVEAYDNGLGRYNGEYSLSIRADVPEAGTQLTDNNSIQTATQLVAGEEPLSEALSGWVGVGDAVDFYRLELAEAGRLTLNLSDLETAAKIKVYAETEEGGARQICSRSVKAAAGLVDHTLSLTSGTYFVAIASYDDGAGRYNTGYALELEHEGQDRHKMRYALACR